VGGGWVGEACAGADGAVFATVGGAVGAEVGDAAAEAGGPVGCAATAGVDAGEIAGAGEAAGTVPADGVAPGAVTAAGVAGADAAAGTVAGAGFGGGCALGVAGAAGVAAAAGFPPPSAAPRADLPQPTGPCAADSFVAAGPAGAGAGFGFGGTRADASSAASRESSTSKIFSFKNPLILSDSSAFSLGSTTKSGVPPRWSRLASVSRARSGALVSVITPAKLNTTGFVSSVISSRNFASNSLAFVESSLPRTTSTSAASWVCFCRSTVGKFSRRNPALRAGSSNHRNAPTATDKLKPAQQLR
jgi:hypothetical protein